MDFDPIKTNSNQKPTPKIKKLSQRTVPEKSGITKLSSNFNGATSAKDAEAPPSKAIGMTAGKGTANATRIGKLIAIQINPPATAPIKDFPFGKRAP